MGKIKNHGIPESAKDMMKHFGKDAFKLNAHEKKFIQEQGFDTEYLFIETKEQRAAQRGWCSHCRKWTTLPVYTPERLAHKEKVKCPKCGCELTVQHAWRMRKDLYDEALVYLYRPSVINPEIVTARAVSVVRNWKGYGYTPTRMQPNVRVDSFYVYTPGEGGKMLKPINNSRIYWAEDTAEYYGWSVYEMARLPSRRDSAYTNSYMGRGGIRDEITVAEDFEGAFEAAKDSPLRYGMREYWTSSYAEDYFLRYWHWAAKYSSVEKLVKIGLADLVARKLNGEGGRAINWRGNDLASILRGRLTKADKAFIRMNDISINALTIWQLLDCKISIEEAAEKARTWDWYGNLFRWKRIKKRVSIEKAYRYIKKRGDRTADIYDDYLEECEKLGYDMTDKAVLFPRDLRTAHAHTMAQIKYKEKRELEDEYKKKRRPAMKRKYEWAAMGLLVVVPERVSDLIAEGEKQHNCVGGYMERVAKGLTDVVFVRSEADPEKSYITMEIHDGKIVQARTKDNGPLDKLGEKFVKAFRRAKLEKKKKARKTA